MEKLPIVLRPVTSHGSDDALDDALAIAGQAAAVRSVSAAASHCARPAGGAGAAGRPVPAIGPGLVALIAWWLGQALWPVRFLGT